MCPADLSCPADPDRPRAASSRSNAEPDVQYGRPNSAGTLLEPFLVCSPFTNPWRNESPLDPHLLHLEHRNFIRENISLNHPKNRIPGFGL